MAVQASNLSLGFITGVVCVVAADGESAQVELGSRQVTLRFADGRAFVGAENQTVPQLATVHEQREGHALKRFQVGDAVLVCDDESGRWGYAERLIDCLQRRYGKHFTYDTV